MFIQTNMANLPEYIYTALYKMHFPSELRIVKNSPIIFALPHFAVCFLHRFLSLSLSLFSPVPVAFASSFTNWGMTPECAQSQSQYEAISSDSVRVLEFSFAAGKTNDDVSIALSLVVSAFWLMQVENVEENRQRERKI